MIRIVILLLALASGGAASWMALGASDEPSVEVAEVQEAPTQEVLVASAELKRGAAIEESHLRWQPWEGEIPPVFISRSSRADATTELKGSLALSDFVAGEPIRADKLAQRGTGYLSSLLPSGKRAIAVRVTAESTAGGFILPNDHVDVVHTAVRPDAAGDAGKVVSRAILSNIRVLAVDQTVSQAADGTSAIGKTVTLEVNPGQIAAVAAAEASGTVSLALRAISDNYEASAVEAEGARPGVVRFFNGGRMSMVEVPSRSDGS